MWLIIEAEAPGAILAPFRLLVGEVLDQTTLQKRKAKAGAPKCRLLTRIRAKRPHYLSYPKIDDEPRDGPPA